MDYSNVVSLHNFEGEAIAVCTWFSDNVATLSDAKKMTSELQKVSGWYELCFSSCAVHSYEPVFIVVEGNPNYGESN